MDFDGVGREDSLLEATSENSVDTVTSQLNLMRKDSMKFGEHKEGEILTETETDSNDEGQNVLEKSESQDRYGGAPHDGLSGVLDYLGFRELLTMESVCKPLRHVVQNDPFYWKNVHINSPLNYTITDDDLLRLTNRARGKVCRLSLERCLKITNDGLKCVLQRNPGLTKLSVSGCIKLKADRVLSDLKLFNSATRPGIKYLRIADIVGLTNEHFDEFKALVGAMENKRSSDYKPRFYSSEHLSLDDERNIDIEICPQCQCARQVYDCPLESCQAKKHSANACRACILCIARCASCGCCLEDRACEEPFCLSNLCFECLADVKKHYDPNMLLFTHGLVNYHCWHCS